MSPTLSHGPLCAAQAPLAISGGVDSMALAFLFSSLLKTSRPMKVADHPVHRFHCIVVDHRLREGSTAEATKRETAAYTHPTFPTSRAWLGNIVIAFLAKSVASLALQVSFLLTIATTNTKRSL
jgi:hypothetical protein